MERLEVTGAQGRSSILIGERLGNLKKYIPDGKLVIITDSRVKELYGMDFPHAEIIQTGIGESNKTIDSVCEIYDRLVKIQADRTCFIVGIGGGIVCDITGFVASTYMRGVRFGFVATTLLAQVDASVGGKNGVNFEGYKNMIGVFNQPEFVICDPDLLDTLPEKELKCGFAEIAKHGAISDSDLFAFLEDNYKGALNLERPIISRLVRDSIVIKTGIVNRDEREKGERKKLNFGHTFGHAVEKVSKLSHGEAVSIGMALASRLSVKRGYLARVQTERIITLLKHLGLPVSLNFNPAKALDAIRHDKKRSGDIIHFVLLKDIGKAVIEAITIKEIEEII